MEAIESGKGTRREYWSIPPLRGLPCSFFLDYLGALFSPQIKSKEDIVSMDNGCVCCTVRGDLVRTLNSLAARRKDFHAILLETTG